MAEISSPCLMWRHVDVLMSNVTEGLREVRERDMLNRISREFICPAVLDYRLQETVLDFKAGESQ